VSTHFIKFFGAERERLNEAESASETETETETETESEPESEPESESESESETEAETVLGTMGVAMALGQKTLNGRWLRLIIAVDNRG